MYDGIYTLKNCVYRGNINLDFFRFCLLKKTSTIKYIPINILYFLMFFLNFIDKKLYYKNFFKFINNFEKKEIAKIIKLFWEKNSYKINSKFLIDKNFEKKIVVCETLDIIIKPIFSNIEVKNFLCLKYVFSTKKINNLDILINLKKEVIDKYKQTTFKYAYFSKKNSLLFSDLGKNNYIVNKKTMKSFKSFKIICSIKKQILTFSLIILFSLGLTFINFAFSLKVADIRNILNYIYQWDVFLLNFVPILLFSLLIYFASSRLWCSFFMVSTLTFVLSFINKIKLVFRDEPFLFSDLKLFNEALMMTSRYEIKITFNIILLLFIVILFTILLLKKYKYVFRKLTRVIGTFVIILLMFIGYKNIYTNKQIYNSVGDQSKINVWSDTQQFQTKGFIYPFIYSSTNKGLNKPENYNEKEVNDILANVQQPSSGINQNINIISIMLEAHADFSQYNIEFVEPVYDSFKQILDNSYHGNLVTNVFGGGTIDTERSFLTGYNSHPNYRTNTNSFVWFFKESGYYTEAMHPCYGYFYNRKNVNEYIGFDNFDYYENKYKDIQTDFLSDNDFFNQIIKGYEQNKKRNQPYFNFSVSYQNHGPYYEGIETDIEYLKKDTVINKETYNLLNNYFWRIKSTNDSLLELLNYFEKESESVIIILFGDHKPYLGENNKGYEALGIDMNSDSIDSFLNIYTTPYIFWANSKAKEITNKDFKEIGNDISPIFLMPTLFEYLNWNGNQFSQILTFLKSDISVITKNMYKINNQYVTTMPEIHENKISSYNNFQYYLATNFKK